MVNAIWGVFIIIGIIFAFLTGKIDIINDQIIGCGKVNVRNDTNVSSLDGVNGYCRRKWFIKSYS